MMALYINMTLMLWVKIRWMGVKIEPNMYSEWNNKDTNVTLLLYYIGYDY